MMRREIALQDRYAYLPSVAFAILAALVIFPKQETRAEVWHPAAAILAFVVLGAMYRGAVTSPHSALMHFPFDVCWFKTNDLA